MSSDRVTTEELIAAYERAGKDERKFVRDLHRAGRGEPEARVFLELLHYFPGAYFTRSGTHGRATPDPGPESRT